MKTFYIVCIVGFFVFTSCSCGNGPVFDSDISQEKDFYENNVLIIVGEGGESGTMFLKAAETYKKENKGEIREIQTGDEFIKTINEYVEENGKIGRLVYFGHGNENGLYVNQHPDTHGSLYANDVKLNEDFHSASIYELDPEVFWKYGWIHFYGCSVAKGYPEKDNLAQRFANYFDVDVMATTGPMEFSLNPVELEEIPGDNYLEGNFSMDIYLVPTYEDEGVVVIHPQMPSSSGYVDVREGQSFEQAVVELKKLGLNFGNEENRFLPYQNITYGEAEHFCEIATKNAEDCAVSDLKRDEWIRNLTALKMIVDAWGIDVAYTDPWYDGYIWLAKNNNFLTEDFGNKTWYTRGEMAELCWDIIKQAEY